MCASQDKWWPNLNNHECKLYVKLFIDNDSHPIQTSIKTAKIKSTIKQQAIFYATFKSRKISKVSIIKVEIWSKNDFSSDDLLVTWITSIKQLLFNGRYEDTTGNFIDALGTWKNEVHSFGTMN